MLVQVGSHIDGCLLDCTKEHLCITMRMSMKKRQVEGVVGVPATPTDSRSTR